MGRELQKKKRRSGIAKVRMNARSKNHPVLANAVIAAHWDKKQTLSQNYRRLGLATRLNGHTGGTAKKVDPVTADVPPEDDRLDIKKAQSPAKTATLEARIERDPKTGAIVRVLEEETSLTKSKFQPLQDPLNDLETAIDEDKPSFPDQHHNSGHIGHKAISAAEPDPEFLQNLQANAARPGGKKPRKQSEREQEWCERLYKKHGQDWIAMFRDQKLNVMQQSEGELKRRITKWLKRADKRM